MKKALVLTITNALLWVVFLILVLTGLIMKFRVSPEDGADLTWHGFKYQEIGEVHFILACTVISLVSVHLWLNRAWIAKILREKRLIATIVLALGALIPGEFNSDSQQY